MNKKTKLILSIVGVSALVVPAVLLIVMTSRTQKLPDVSSGKREIDTKAIVDTLKKSQPTPSPLPSPATPSASPKTEGTQSAR